MNAPMRLACLLVVAGAAWPTPRAEEFPAPAPPLEHVRLATEYHREHGGIALVIYHGSTLLLEDYADGRSPDLAHALGSATESFWGVAAAAAEEDGLFQLRDAVSETLESWRDDGRKQRITIRQLLTLSSGIEPALELRGPRIADKFQYARVLPLVNDPGLRFRHGPAAFYVFGEVLRTRLGESPLVYLKSRVFEAIDLKLDGWSHDEYGQPEMADGARLSALEWAKFGLLVRDEGMYAGKRIIAAGSLEPLLRAGRATPAYGLGFWLNAPAPVEHFAMLTESARVRRALRRSADETGLTRLSPSAPEDLALAAGQGSQRLYILRSRDLVIARLADSTTFVDDEFLSRLLHGRPPERRSGPPNATQTKEAGG